MADPLSITVSVVALIKVAGHAAILLREFCIDVGGVHATLSGLLTDVAGFQQVLEGMKETFEQDDIKSNLTGHAGTHWKNLARSLKDGEATLQQLTDLLESVNKSTRFLDGPRKTIRYRTAAEQIGLFREQIQSYRAALELSLSTVILWNQVTFQKSNEKITSQILPSLDKLFEEFRRLGNSLNARIEELQGKGEKEKEETHQLSSMRNLRECVRSAAEVASTTSSTLTANRMGNEHGSVKYGSDLGDVFVKEPDEMMLRWISDNTVPEEETLTQSATSYIATEHDSDSDSDIEAEMIQALFDSANRLKDDGELKNAERKLRSCLSLSPYEDIRADRVSKRDVLEALIDVYWLMESWEAAKKAMNEKMSIAERQQGTRDESYIWDTLKLAMLSKKNKDYTEAQLQARRALRGFRKLRETGFPGYEKCLLFLIELCNAQEKHDEEDAYTALLASHQAKHSGKIKDTHPDSLKPPGRIVPVAKPVKEKVDTGNVGSKAVATERVKDQKEDKANSTTRKAVLIPKAKPKSPVTRGITSEREISAALNNIATKPLELPGVVLYDTSKVMKKYKTHLELLDSYGLKLYGQKPRLGTFYSNSGWNCLVHFRDTKGYLVTRMTNQDMAWENAIVESCDRFCHDELERFYLNGEKFHDPSSDKEVYMPETWRKSENILHPDLVIAVNVGLKDTAIAFRHYSPLHWRRIQHLPIQGIFNAPPSRSLLDEISVPLPLVRSKEPFRATTWGVLAEPRTESDLQVRSRKYPSGAERHGRLWEPAPNELDYYVAALLSFIQASLRAHLKVPWSDAKIDFLITTPVNWRLEEDSLRSAFVESDFKLSPNHKLSITGFDADIILRNAALAHGFDRSQKNTIIACQVTNAHLTLSEWAYTLPGPSFLSVLRVYHRPRTQDSVDALFRKLIMDRVADKHGLGAAAQKRTEGWAYRFRNKKPREAATIPRRDDWIEVVNTTCQSQEYRDIIASHGNGESAAKGSKWEVLLPDQSESERVPGIFFDSGDIEKILETQFESLRRALLDFRTVLERGTGRKVTHIVLYGTSEALPYDMRHLRNVYMNTGRVGQNTKVVLSTDKAAEIAEGTADGHVSLQNYVCLDGGI